MPPCGRQPGAAGLGWLGTGLVLTLLAVACGLGLADTSVRMPMGDSTDAEPDLAVERSAAAGAAGKPARKSRRKAKESKA